MSSGGGCDESCSRDAADGVVGVVGEIEAGAGRGGRHWGWQWDLSSLRVVEGQLIAACVGSRRKKEGDEVCSVRFGDMEARRSRVGSRHGEGRKLGGPSGLEARRHEGMQAWRRRSTHDTSHRSPFGSSLEQSSPLLRPIRLGTMPRPPWSVAEAPPRKGLSQMVGRT